jgi:hypothetical protein
MILLWEGVDTFTVYLDFKKSRKQLELQLAQAYMEAKKVSGPPERLLEYVFDNLAVFAPLTDYLMRPEVNNAEVLLSRWLKLYESVNPEWRPYISTRVRYMLSDTRTDKSGAGGRTLLITGKLANSLRSMNYSEFININPADLVPELKREAAGYSPAAFIHQQAKALTRAFTSFRKIVHV